MAEKPTFIPKHASPYSVGVEPLISLKDAATILGLPYHVVQKATRNGALPSYRLDRRIRVRVSELEAVLQQFKCGGAA